MWFARRDIEKISIDNGYKEKKFYKFEWDIKTKEEKQQFISKYIDNIVIDKTDKGSLDIKQINFRSSFIDKVVKLTQIGAYDYKLPFEVNHKEEMVLVSSPMKRKQVNKYLEYLREYFEIVYREDKGDRSENGMSVFDSPIPENLWKIFSNYFYDGLHYYSYIKYFNKKCLIPSIFFKISVIIILS